MSWTSNPISLALGDQTIVVTMSDRSCMSPASVTVRRRWAESWHLRDCR